MWVYSFETSAVSLFGYQISPVCKALHKLRAPISGAKCNFLFLFSASGESSFSFILNKTTSSPRSLYRGGRVLLCILLLKWRYWILERWIGRKVSSPRSHPLVIVGALLILRRSAKVVMNTKYQLFCKCNFLVRHPHSIHIPLNWTEMVLKAFVTHCY